MIAQHRNEEIGIGTMLLIGLEILSLFHQFLHFFFLVYGCDTVICKKCMYAYLWSLRWLKCISLLFSYEVVSNSLRLQGLQHARLLCLSLSPDSDTCVHWVSDATQPSHPLLSTFSSCSQSFPASVSFPVSQLFASGGQSIGASASVLPMNIQGWFPLQLTSFISLLSKGLSRVFSSTTIWKHQFLGTQPSLLSSSHIRTWLLEKP